MNPAENVKRLSTVEVHYDQRKQFHGDDSNEGVLNASLIL